MSTEEEAIAYRDQVNWRSVSRADPSVQQILNTCSFCSVFIFDKVKDGWAKQNQEGSLFLVRRNKSPEYALYMLNRGAPKNPLWALVPGEMRVTPTSDNMLIVERKGEGVKTGIHFADGAQSVEEFRSTILSICGDVRQPGSTSATPSQTPVKAKAPPQPGFAKHTSGPPQDDLSRLFSGLLASSTSSSSRPASTSSNPAPSAPPPPPANNGHMFSNPQSNSTIPAPYTQQSRPRTISPPARPDTPPSPPITFSEMPVLPPPPLSPGPPQPAGQTVADLLNSISGGSQYALPPITSRVLHPVPQSQARPPTQAPLAPPLAQIPPPPPHVPTPPPPPPPVPVAQRPRDPPAPQDPRHVIQGAIVDHLPAGYQPSGPDPRIAFQRDLIELLQRDPAFVDQLFRAFQASRS